VNAPGDPQLELAHRLRVLRETGLAGRTITQIQLAEAFSARESASGPLISSWERIRKPVTPPASRLEAYATFFATERSVATEPYRLLKPSELTTEERLRRDELLGQLTELRNAAVGFVVSVEGTLWKFPPQQDITIICAELPDEMRRGLPYADPKNPDYVRMYGFTDLDALFELYGHIRSVNPTNWVNIGTPEESLRDLYTAHLVVLGGVDWNRVTRDLLRLIRLPVRQLPRETESDAGGFQVDDGKETAIFQPVLENTAGHMELLEDVAHFYRGPNPFNQARTATICNGMYGRGTLGAVRALTDTRFRDRNEEYVRQHLRPSMFSIIARVLIVSGEVVTPDWTLSDIRLHEWPKEPRHAGDHG
jgi:hypothetical protein